MKKIKILSIASLPLVMAVLAGCGEDEPKPDPKPDPTPHTHHFKTEWSYDSTNHWHACDGEGCDAKDSLAPHTLVEGKCECGYEVGKLGYTIEINGVSKTLTVDPGNDKQYLTGEVELKAGDQTSFYIVGGTEKELIKVLTLEDEQFGFSFNEGNLASVVSGKFEFVLKVDNGTYALSVSKGKVEKVYKGFVYVNDSPLYPEGAPFTFLEVDKDDACVRYYVGPQEISSGAKVTLEIKKGDEVQTIFELEGSGIYDFELSNEGKLLTYIGAGTDEYTFIVNESIINGLLRLEIEKKSSPIPENDCRLMGYNGDWDAGLIMQEESPSVYTSGSLDINPGDKFKVKFNDVWMDNYRLTGDNYNAFEEHLAEVDEEGNVKFNFSGVFTILFDCRPESRRYGVTVLRESVTCNYLGFAEFRSGTIIIAEEESFGFNKVDVANNLIEYSLIRCPAMKGMNYNVEVKKDDVTKENVDFTLEDTVGEGPNFTKVDKTITYNGEASYLDFYLKEDLSDHSLSVYVEEHLTTTYDLRINCESEQATWAFSEEVDLFVGAFNRADETTWIKVSATDNVVNVSVPRDTERFLMVRCVKGTETPNWELKSGDEVGRIYNQTSPDTTLVKGPGIYTVHFIDYPRPV